MSSNAVIIVLVLIVLAILGYFTLRPLTTSSTTVVVPPGTVTATPTPLISPSETQVTPTEIPTPSGSDTSLPLQESYTIKASNYTYDVQSIQAKLNDKVKITLMNTQGTHDLVIDGYNVSTKMLKEGQSQTIQFVANKPGTYEYYCSVGNNRAMGMTGQLVVE